VDVPEDPGAATEEAKVGRIAFYFGVAWEKGIAIGTGPIGTGQCPVGRPRIRRAALRPPASSG
jgi:glutathione-independent formaldehyde dehydrogenase